jgi:hypothetical protein
VTSLPAACTNTAINSSTAALIAGSLGGGLLISTDTTSGDGLNIQWKGEAFLPRARNRIYYGISFQASEATDSQIFAGLAITTTEAMAGVTDGIYFRKADNVTAIKHVVETASTETETAAATLVASTDTVLEWTWDGSEIVFYVDGTETGTPAVTYIPTAEYMSPVIEYLSGSNGAKTMTVNWMRCIQIPI